MGDLTRNFSREEFACKCGCGFDDVDIGLVNRLQVIRDIAGKGILIHSGCRCFKHNKKVGGKPGSLHLRGKACDWSFIGDGDGVLLRSMAEMLKEWSGGFHYYDAEKFIHCDVGDKRRW